MRSVTSRQNPAVRECRALADTPAPDGTRILLDGMHLVRDALSAGWEMEMVLVAASTLETSQEIGGLAFDLDARGVDVVSVTDSVLSAASPVRTPSGILAIAHRLQPPSTVGLYQHPRALIVTAVDVQDPGNIGALLRVAEAGGATGACIYGASANPFSWRALRGSMGSALRLPIVLRGSRDHAAAHTAFLDEMHAARLATVAAVPRGGADPDRIDWRSPTALLLGGEGGGLTPDVVAACTARVTIPMSATVESLNIAAAGAILVYAARRQRA
jgi:TrmH family RNA methyltransferase